RSLQLWANNPSGTSWSSGNTSIATVSGGTITGQSPGVTNIVAIASNYPVYATVCSGANEVGCPQASPGGSTPVQTGQTLPLLSEDCFHPAPNGDTPYTVGWGVVGGCILSQLIDNFPAGGKCVAAQGPSGTVNCWQTVANGCTTTTCPINSRTADKACTQFIDGIHSAESSTKTCP
ncbi:MAG: hypothetical protein WBQ94_02465, partial [Terracidiphilus sp.]